VRYGGPDSELIEKHEWWSWSKHAKYEKKPKRPPKMRSPQASGEQETDEDEPSIAELEDENAFLRQRLEAMEKSMKQMQQAMVEAAADDVQGRRKVETVDSETQTDEKKTRERGTGMPVVKKTRKGTQTAEKETGMKRTQTISTGPMGPMVQAEDCDQERKEEDACGAAESARAEVQDGGTYRPRAEKAAPSAALRQDDETVQELAMVLRNPIGEEIHSPLDRQRPSSAKARAEMQYILEHTMVPLDKLFALNEDNVSATFGGGDRGEEALFTMLSPSLNWKQKAENGTLEEVKVRRRSIYTEIRQQESNWNASAGGQALRKTSAARIKNAKREELAKVMGEKKYVLGAEGGELTSTEPAGKSRRWFNKQREKTQHAGAAARRAQRHEEKVAPSEEKGSFWKKR
jgi:hypothetical protein